jgi:tyrosyl-tRNA synthetase
MGGSDQWGNITAGIELQRKLKGQPLFGLTFPLLTRSDGKKFGKSEEGAIWLSAERLSPYDFYQYFVRIPDADVIRLLKVLTFVDLEEIQEIEASMSRSDYIPNQAQKKLAEEVTRLIHGEEGLSLALRMTQNLAPGAETVLSTDSLKALLADLDPMELSEAQVVGQKVVEVAFLIGVASSKSEIVRLIKNGGLYLNNQKVLDPAAMIQASDLIGESYLLLSLGKKKKILVKIRLQNIR